MQSFITQNPGVNYVNNLNRVSNMPRESIESVRFEMPKFTVNVENIDSRSESD